MTDLRAIDFSRAGMLRQQQRLDVTAQNIAAGAVPGFKVGRVALESGADVAPPAQSDTPSLQPLSRVDHLFTQGAIEQSPSPYDLAIEGEGFFALQASDGSTVYTRDGAFHLNTQRQLVDDAGRVLQPGITVPDAASGLSLQADGTLVATFQDGSTTPLGSLQLAVFQNANGLLINADGTLTPTQESGQPVYAPGGSPGVGRVQPGALEGSNTDITQSLADAADAQRAYELNLSAFQIADQMYQIASQLQPGSS